MHRLQVGLQRHRDRQLRSTPNLQPALAATMLGRCCCSSKAEHSSSHAHSPHARESWGAGEGAADDQRQQGSAATPGRRMRGWTHRRRHRCVRQLHEPPVWPHVPLPCRPSAGPCRQLSAGTTDDRGCAATRSSALLLIDLQRLQGDATDCNTLQRCLSRTNRCGTSESGCSARLW